MKTHRVHLQIPKAFKELFDPYRYKVFYGGRGGAKSTAYAQALLILAMQKKTRVLCARELQVSINDSVHKLLADQIEAMGLSCFFEVQKATILGANGSEFLFKGLRHNATEIKSTEGVNYCWVEEAEKVSQVSWELLVPTIRREDSEIWVSFNPRYASDATYKRFILGKPWDAIVKKVSWKDNPFFPRVLERERLELLESDPEAYEHIWEGNLDNRFFGGIYSPWVEKLRAAGRITDKVKWDPNYPVYTAWDLGFDDSTAIWFYQVSPTEILVIDYYETNGEAIGHYCGVLKEKGYRYGAHFVPQDAGHKLLQAGGRSIVEQAWKDYDIKMTVLSETTHQNRIAAARKTLPRCWFAETATAEGIDALMNYRYQYDEDKKTFRTKPYHDWSSHGSTAYEILARIWTQRSVTTKELDKRENIRKFERLRQASGLTVSDPYRVKPRIGKR